VVLVAGNRMDAVSKIWLHLPAACSNGMAEEFIGRQLLAAIQEHS
jgi:hypothetical protein